MVGSMAAGRCGADAGSERIILILKYTAEREWTGKSVCFWKLRTHPQWHTSFHKLALPDLSRTVPSAGYQTFKHEPEGEVLIQITKALFWQSALFCDSFLHPWQPPPVHPCAPSCLCLLLFVVVNLPSLVSAASWNVDPDCWPDLV